MLRLVLLLLLSPPLLLLAVLQAALRHDCALVERKCCEAIAVVLPVPCRYHRQEGK
jgi:hypothetical protein